MLRIFATEYEVASCFIKYYKLKKNMQENQFQIFRNDNISLIISGKGQIKAAMAVGYFMKGYEYSREDVFLCLDAGTYSAAIATTSNTGNKVDLGSQERSSVADDIVSCDSIALDFVADSMHHNPVIQVLGEAFHRKDSTFLINEIYDVHMNRYFYPDMCPVHEFEEISSTSQELSAFYQTLTMFIKQHQLICMSVGRNCDMEKIAVFLADYIKSFENRKPFSHIYVERKLKGDADTEKVINDIVTKHPDKRVVWINHYKDIFNRKNQDIIIQKKSPALIIARKDGQLVYNGSSECQNFGNEHFYYTTSMMNCLFDCEYCYLQGMYPSANVTFFVNIEDIFKEVDRLLEKHPVYLCVSYDTDLMAFESIGGYCRKWLEYAALRPSLTIEIRTKACISDSFIKAFEKNICENIIIAFTLSSDMVQLSYEHNTPSPAMRINSVKKAIEAGMSVRICLDPLIYTENWKTEYEELVNKLFTEISPDSLKDISYGQFRVPCDYIKRMKKKRPDSKLLAYPFETVDNSSCYGKKGEEMADYVEKLLLEHMPLEKLFRW